jgi:hypothetical protein
MQAVLATLRDPSFTFVDALSVAAWGRIGGLRHRAETSRLASGEEAARPSRPGGA